MKIEKFLSFICFLILMTCSSNDDSSSPDPDPDPVNQCDAGFCIKVATYNVAVGKKATPLAIATRLQPLNLDVLTLTECPTLIDPNSPDKDFIEIIAEKLEMPYWEIGTISSSDHWEAWGTDISGKYHGKLKAILSKTPLSNSEDIALNGSGWSPASTLKATTTIESKTITIYALHIPGSNDTVTGSVHKDLADRIIANETSSNFIVTGDFNDIPSNATMSYINDKGMSNALDDLDNLADRIDDYTPGRIDNILYNTNSNAKGIDGFSTYVSSLSDHPYVWVRLLYK